MSGIALESVSVTESVSPAVATCGHCKAFLLVHFSPDLSTHDSLESNSRQDTVESDCYLTIPTEAFVY